MCVGARLTQEKDAPSSVVPFQRQGEGTEQENPLPRGLPVRERYRERVTPNLRLSEACPFPYQVVGIPEDGRWVYVVWLGQVWRYVDLLT